MSASMWLYDYSWDNFPTLKRTFILPLSTFYLAFLLVIICQIKYPISLLTCLELLEWMEKNPRKEEREFKEFCLKNTFICEMQL